MFGPEQAASLPAVYDPAQVATQQQQALSIKDQLENRYRELTFGEQMRHNKSTEGLTAQQIAEAQRHNTANERIGGGNLAVAQGNLNVSRQRLAQEQQSPKGVVDSERGLVIDPRTGSAIPITADGAPVGAKQPNLREIPVSVNKAILENQQGLANIDRAIAAIDATPRALGPVNMIPGAQTVRQYTNPEGVAARANVADIGSLKLHDRSGAAVSASEFPRLAPFIPSASDSPATAKKKLQQFKENFQLEAELLGQQYSEDQGYRSSPLLSGNKQPAMPAQRTQQSSAPPPPAARATHDNDPLGLRR